MKFGFGFIGPGLAAYPEIISLVAKTSEECGFHSLWSPEHIVLLDEYSSKYPYNPDGKMGFAPEEMDFLDPFLALTYAAAETNTIRLGTGICLVPERNPLVTAKEVASLDRLSGGRFDFGVGIGWLKEEFEAIGVPWSKRAQRTADYLEAMQAAWSPGASSHKGDFCEFSKVRSYPKPTQQPHPPIFFGGESEPALRRVGELGDGWWGINVSIEGAKQHVATIKRFAEGAGRDASNVHYAVSKNLGGEEITLDEAKQYADLGIDQIIVGKFAASAEEFKQYLEKTAETLIVPLS
tara:strand:+ start:1106 stop:1987 length:882 start_codon:yes stop_codon:yes gene_type:complete